MTSADECAELARLSRGIFRKLLEDLFEAYARTPYEVSSRPHIERALSLAKAGLTYSERLVELCMSQGGGKEP
jgi:hypothetical protein